MLETERLVLRRWRAEDVDALAAVDGDPEVMRYVGDGRPRDRARTAEAVASMERAWEERGFGLFAVQVREGGALAGWVGLAEPAFLPEVMPAVEIGWRLGRGFWGRGYATEAGREVLRFAFGYARLPRLVSIRHVDNVRSARVMERLGFVEERRAVVPSSGAPVVVCALSRGRYLRSAGAGVG